MNFKKKYVAYFLIAVISIFSFSPTLSAHEMYYSGSAPNWTAIPVKWSNLTNGKPYLKVNGDRLSSDYTSAYSTAATLWSTYSQKVVIDKVGYGSSNVDIASATKAYWSDRFGVGGAGTLGIADLKTTDGIVIDSSTVQQSSKRISYAQIYMTPYVANYSSTNPGNHKVATIVHEMGHVLGLGHPNANYYPTSVESIMRTGGKYEGYYVPRQHDLNDINNKY